MPWVRAVNYGEYDSEKYLALLDRSYVTFMDGLFRLDTELSF